MVGTYDVVNVNLMRIQYIPPSKKGQPRLKDIGRKRRVNLKFWQAKMMYSVCIRFDTEPRCSGCFGVHVTQPSLPIIYDRVPVHQSPI